MWNWMVPKHKYNIKQDKWITPSNVCTHWARSCTSQFWININHNGPYHVQVNFSPMCKYIRNPNPKINNGFKYSGTQHRLQK